MISICKRILLILEGIDSKDSSLAEIGDLIAAIDAGSGPLDMDSFFKSDLAEKGSVLREFGVTSKLNYKYVGKKGISDFVRYGNGFTYAAGAVDSTACDLSPDRAGMLDKGPDPAAFESQGHMYMNVENRPLTTYDFRGPTGTRPSIFLTASGYDGPVPDYQYGRSRESTEEGYGVVRLHP